MRLIEAEQKLLALHQPVIQTRDVSACLNISHAQASKILDHLARVGR
jgi:Mn-dependent DtxR family transcriptional regulator